MKIKFRQKHKTLFFSISKDLGLKTALMTVTFVIGIMSSFISRFESSPAVIFDEPPMSVSFCQLVRNPDSYNGKIISVEAEIVDSDGVLLASDRTCPVNVAFKNYKLGKKVNENLREYVDQNRNSSIKINVVGEFFSRERITCFPVKGVINTTEINFSIGE